MVNRSLLLLVPASLAWTQTVAPKPKTEIRSGQMLICRVDAGCTEQNVNGKQMFTLEADGFTVVAALHFDAMANYADVSVTNNSPYKAEVIPANFRIEVRYPAFRRLSYIDPNTVAQKRLEAKREDKRVHDLPPPWYFTDPDRAKASPMYRMWDRPVTASVSVPATTALLKRQFLEPAASASGRVYFERWTGMKTLKAKKTGAESRAQETPDIQRIASEGTDASGSNINGMSLIVPIAGENFQFPNWGPRMKSPDAAPAPAAPAAPPGASDTTPPAEPAAVKPPVL